MGIETGAGLQFDQVDRETRQTSPAVRCTAKRVTSTGAISSHCQLLKSNHLIAGQLLSLEIQSQVEWASPRPHHSLPFAQWKSISSDIVEANYFIDFLPRHQDHFLMTRHSQRPPLQRKGWNI